MANGLGFLPSWLIEPHFNDHSLHGRYRSSEILNYAKLVNFFHQRTIRLLLDTRDTVEAFGLGIDREVALALYRVGSETEYGEVNKILDFTQLFF